MAETTPVQTVKKPLNFIVGLALAAVTIGVLVYVGVKAAKKAKS